MNRTFYYSCHLKPDFLCFKKAVYRLVNHTVGINSPLMSLIEFLEIGGLNF